MALNEKVSLFITKHGDIDFYKFIKQCGIRNRQARKLYFDETNEYYAYYYVSRNYLLEKYEKEFKSLINIIHNEFKLDVKELLSAHELGNSVFDQLNQIINQTSEGETLRAVYTDRYYTDIMPKAQEKINSHKDSELLALKKFFEKADSNKVDKNIKEKLNDVVINGYNCVNTLIDLGKNANVKLVAYIENCIDIMYKIDPSTYNGNTSLNSEL